ncbi:MAG: hypothetical protein ABF294_10445 [Flavobacteriales bacterium]
MYRKDGTPDFRFAVNRTAYRTAGSEKSSLGFGFEASLVAEYFGEANKRASVLRDFRDELLEIEPNVINRLFELTEGTYWCENTAKKNEMPYEFRWLNKSTPDVVLLTEDTNYKDKFEQLIDAKESTLFANYIDVVRLINGFLENKLKALYGDENKKLFETNIEILNVILSVALDVETKVISENLKNETLRKEKENIRFQNWVKKHGYCTVNREQTYDYGLKQYSLLTRTELVNIKQEIPNYLWSKNDSSVRWLKHIDFTKQALIKLKYLSEDELMFIKEEYLTNLDSGVCELELERRLNLNFWKKIYEIVFVRLEFNPEYLIRLLFSTFRIWIKGKKST